MGLWEEYCVICGAPMSLIGLENTLVPLHRKYTWLQKFMGINKDNKKIPLEGYDYGPHLFDKNHNKFVITSWDWDFYAKNKVLDYGIAVHKDCYKLLKKEFNYDIKFTDVYDFLNKKAKKTNFKFYKSMTKHMGQFFNDDQPFPKSSYYLLESPLKNEKNKKRILGLWRTKVNQYKKKEGSTKINKKSISPGRPSPSESATKFRKGHKKTGNDGNKWIVIETKNGVKRWSKFQ